MSGDWERGTGYALKSDLELKIDDAIDSRDLDVIHGCLRFAWGYLRAVTVMGDAAGAYKLPLGVNDGQIKAVYLKWAAEHPEKLHLAAWGCASWALAEAFPAPGGSRLTPMLPKE
jgi:hypothetical protein